MCTLSIPALRRQRQMVLPGLRGQPGLYNEFQASQDYIVKEILSERERRRRGREGGRENY